MNLVWAWELLILFVGLNLLVFILVAYLSIELIDRVRKWV